MPSSETANDPGSEAPDAGVGRSDARDDAQSAAPEQGAERAYDRELDLALDAWFAASPAAWTDRAVARGAAREPAAAAALQPAHATRSPALAGLLGQLRATLARYVGERRDAGLPVERVVPEVTALVRQATACEGWHDSAGALMTRVVGWTVAVYHDRPLVPHGARVH
jgi:hypothetical protein